MFSHADGEILISTLWMTQQKPYCKKKKNFNIDTAVLKRCRENKTAEVHQPNNITNWIFPGLLSMHIALKQPREIRKMAHKHSWATSIDTDKWTCQTQGRGRMEKNVIFFLLGTVCVEQSDPNLHARNNVWYGNTTVPVLSSEGIEQIDS